MSSSYTNMAAGAFLGTCFVAMTLSIVSGAIYDSPNPEKEGFVIKAEQPKTDSGASAKPAVPPIAPLLAKADVKQGEQAFKVCGACHNDTKGGANKIGPDLWGVVGRHVAEHEGFSYSSALKKFSDDGKKTWDFEKLNHWLHDPRGYVSGTAMTFPGIKDDQKRADVIAYLNQQSDKPEPLPKPGEAKGGDNSKAGDKAKAGDDAKAGEKTDQTSADKGGDAKASDQSGTDAKSSDQGSGKMAPENDNSSGSSSAPQPGTEKAPANGGSATTDQKPADQGASGQSDDTSGQTPKKKPVEDGTAQ